MSRDFIKKKCVSSLLYRKISLSQLHCKKKTLRHHTTASRDLVRPCANAELLQDAFSADAPCTEVIVGQWHPVLCSCSCNAALLEWHLTLKYNFPFQSFPWWQHKGLARLHPAGVFGQNKKNHPDYKWINNERCYWLKLRKLTISST